MFCASATHLAANARHSLGAAIQLPAANPSIREKSFRSLLNFRPQNLQNRSEFRSRRLTMARARKFHEKANSAGESREHRRRQRCRASHGSATVGELALAKLCNQGLLGGAGK
jgi:hypothetical protein